MPQDNLDIPPEHLAARLWKKTPRGLHRDTVCTNFTPAQQAQWVEDKLGVDLPAVRRLLRCTAAKWARPFVDKFNLPAAIRLEESSP